MRSQIVRSRFRTYQASTQAGGEISRFALTFDTYKYWGSFEKCAEIANARRAESLTDLRTCLFFEQRRWRHYGYRPDDEAMSYIRNLLRSIKAIVADKNAAR